MAITIENNLLEEIPDYEVNKMVLFMQAFDKTRIDLFIEKDKHYGGSWMKDGILGAYFNLKRKIDRVLTRFTNGTLFSFENDSTSEASLDTFMDLNNYSTMNVAFLFFTIDKEENFESFCQKIPELKKYFVFNGKKIVLK